MFPPSGRCTVRARRLSTVEPPSLERPCPQQIHKIESRLPGQHIGELGLGAGSSAGELWCRSLEPHSAAAALP